MPLHPTAPPAARTTETETRPAATERELTVNKVIAGAGAAATAAVLGSYLGAAGTVTGAAIGSVASTVATTLYQRSLDRTRETVVTRIRLPGRRGQPVDPEHTIPLQRDAEPETVVLRPAAPPRPRRRLRNAAIATAAVFVLGLLAVTGLEWVKGSTVTQGESGTSVGRVLAPQPATEEPAAPADPDADDATQDADPSTEPSTDPLLDPSTEPSAPEDVQPSDPPLPDVVPDLTPGG